MNEEMSYGQFKTLKDKAKKMNQEYYLEQSRKRLDKIVATKIRTTFIGAIAAFEDSFGFLWGHGKCEEDLEDAERDMRELWQQTRNRILGHGNGQLRAAQSEINNHTISWNRYKLNIPIKQLTKEDQE